MFSLCFVTCLLSAEPCKQMSSEVMQALEDIMSDIYHLDVQEIQDIVCQDFGCIPEITAEELLERMATEDDLLVVNVLSENWYQDCHISGSVNVPLNDLVHRVQDWDREKKIVVYCALDECDAGEKAYVLLRCMGFSHVVDYPGGMKEWFQFGCPVEGPCAGWYLHEQSRSFNCLPSEFNFKEALKVAKN